MQAVEYGIYCKASDEKELVRNVNLFLAHVGYRKLYKWVPAGKRNPDQPEVEPRYAHYYCQFLKEHPQWYFDLYPNTDLDGKARFPEQPDVGWTLYLNKVAAEQNSVGDNASLDKFFSDLAGRVGFSVLVLNSYTRGENRI